MGGIGSGTWVRSEKKTSVEDSMELAMRDIRERIYPNASGTLTWVWPGGKQASIGYRVTWETELTMTLFYNWQNSEDIKIPIYLQTTPTRFGGQRRWFTCPAMVDGAECDRRVEKLYLPPGERYFGCRTCHNLAFQSSQQAHRNERGTGTFESMERWANALIKRGL